MPDGLAMNWMLSGVTPSASQHSRMVPTQVTSSPL